MRLAALDVGDELVRVSDSLVPPAGQVLVPNALSPQPADGAEPAPAKTLCLAEALFMQLGATRELSELAERRGEVDEGAQPAVRTRSQ